MDRSIYMICGLSLIVLTKNASSIFANNKINDWSHSHPQRVYFIFNGYSQQEAETTLNQALRNELYLKKNKVFNGLKSRLVFSSQLNSDLPIVEDDFLKQKGKETDDAKEVNSSDNSSDIFGTSELNSENDNSSNSREGNDATNILRYGFCSKGASKACSKACRHVLKNVCDTYKCSKGMKSTFKRECRKNCLNRFVNGRSSYDYPRPPDNVDPNNNKVIHINGLIDNAVTGQAVTDNIIENENVEDGD